MSLKVHEPGTGHSSPDGQGELVRRAEEYVAALHRDECGNGWRWRDKLWGGRRSQRVRETSGAYLAAYTPEALPRTFPEVYDVMCLDEVILCGIIEHPAGIDINRATPTPVGLLLSRVRDAIADALPELRDRDVRKQEPLMELHPTVREMVECHREYMDGVTRGNIRKRKLYALEEKHIRLHNDLPESFPAMYDIVVLDADMLPPIISNPEYSDPAPAGHLHWLLRYTLEHTRFALHRHFPELIDRERALTDAQKQYGIPVYRSSL